MASTTSSLSRSPHLDEALEATRELAEELAVRAEPALKAARIDLATTDQDPSKARKLLVQAKKLLEWAGDDDGLVANLLRLIGMVMAPIVPAP
ncbi:hypothetical protein [Luteococcus sp.]|uniref:hypothetical protein n=1 Tax=Luteococcus sp. TaxID=1969402 RepID=UPI0037356B89